MQNVERRYHHALQNHWVDALKVDNNVIIKNHTVNVLQIKLVL